MQFTRKPIRVRVPIIDTLMTWSETDLVNKMIVTRNCTIKNKTWPETGLVCWVTFTKNWDGLIYGMIVSSTERSKTRPGQNMVWSIR